MVKAYSVRLKSLVSISDKAYKAESFDGSSDILPKSVVFGRDLNVVKSDAYWIAAWILPKKNIQWSPKKEALFDDNGNQISIEVKKYAPYIIEPVESNIIEDLKR